MEPADDAESRRPLFQSWVGKLRELPENAKVSSVRFPEVSTVQVLAEGTVMASHTLIKISQHQTDHEAAEPSPCLSLALQQSSRSQGSDAVALWCGLAKEDLLHAALPVTDSLIVNDGVIGQKTKETKLFNMLAG